jgi:hypothetical protein
MRKQALLPLLAALALGSSACTSVSVYQSAKTLPQGKGQTGFSLGGGKFRSKARISDFELDVPSVSMEAWGRYGFTDKLEAGLKYSLPGALTLDARYGLLREETGAAVSLAAGLGLARAELSTAHTGYDDKTSISDVIVPLYISRDLSDAVTAYVVPRYVRRFITNERTSVGGQTEYINSDMVGIGGGFMFNLGRNRTTHLSLEFHKVFEPADPSHYTQNGGVGLAFDF